MEYKEANTVVKLSPLAKVFLEEMRDFYELKSLSAVIHLIMREPEKIKKEIVEDVYCIVAEKYDKEIANAMEKADKMGLRVVSVPEVTTEV